MVRILFLLLVAALAAALAVAAPAGGGPAATAAQAEDTPVLSPITATFYESLRMTRYNVTLSNRYPGPVPVWRWDFTPDPADPTCNQFKGDVGGPESGSAGFEHGDDKGCKHTTPDHNVEIEVVVTTGPYTCNARIHGTTTHVGTTPEPCFKRPTTPPLPKASAPPTITKPNKKKWHDAAAVNFAAGTAAGTNALLWAVVPVPDPVTKGIAVASLGAAVVNLTAGLYALYKAQDPPDPNFKTVAKAVVPRPALLKATGGVTAAEAAAVNALLRNMAGIVANDRAFLTAFERAQGAYAAKDGAWDHTQSLAAAKFARAEATLIDRQPALERAVRRAVASAAATSTRRLSVSDARRLARPTKLRLPASAVALLRAFGLNATEVASMQARIGKVSPAASAGPAATKLGTPATAAVARTAAGLLRALAKTLDAR